MYVVSIGNPYDGISLVGPFDTTEEANEYADGLNDEWHVMELTPPPIDDNEGWLGVDEDEHACPFCTDNECRTGAFVNSVVGGMG